MSYQTITPSQTLEFNKLANHPLQTYEWGEFRKKTGIKVIRKAKIENNQITSAFQITIHKIPHIPFFAGYFPKGNTPDTTTIEALKHIGNEEKCIFIQLEPTIERKDYPNFPDRSLNLQDATHPLFTKFTFHLDLTKNEDELLKNMHPKTRYNIKVAQKNGVTVVEDDSEKAFETYIKLTNETTSRQGFYAHSEKYHRLMWETLKAESSKNLDTNKLTAHLLIAKYHKPSAISYTSLVAWILFVFKDTIYYPYGASSSQHREVMASNLMMWEAIKFGKKLGLKKFDMWGALGTDPDPKDPWYGFHRFKQGYGPEHIEFVGSYDLVTNPLLYPVYSIADKVRWFLLNLKK